MPSPPLPNSVNASRNSLMLRLSIYDFDFFPIICALELASSCQGRMWAEICAASSFDFILVSACNGQNITSGKHCGWYSDLSRKHVCNQTLQELRMLSSVTINCQITMIVWIQVFNCQNCDQCLKCHKSPGLSFQLSKLSKIVIKSDGEA